MNNLFEVIEARLNNIKTILLELKHQPEQEQLIDTNRWLNIKDQIEHHPNKSTKQTGYFCATYGIHKGVKKLESINSEMTEWLQQRAQKNAKEIASQIDNQKKKKGGLDV